MCTKGNVKGDTCAKATKVKLGKTYTGRTVFADVDSEAPTCNGIEPVSGGVWYEVKGNGGLFQASTCGFTSLLLNSQVSVYEGGCTELSCVTANSAGEGCTDGRGEAFFLTETGTTYSILVHGFGSVFGNETSTTEGAFEFVVNEIPRKECFFPTFFPGCEDLICEASVCASNPFCCDVGWDYTCVLDACDLCEASSGTAALCEDCTRSELGISIETDFFPNEITWEVVSITKDNAIVAKGGPYLEPLFVYEETVENLCISDCYEFLIFDSFGDGLSVGPGTYNITWLGETIPSPSDGFYEFFDTIIFGNCP